MPCRLCSDAPLTTTSLALETLRLFAGTGIDSRPVRYAPVSDSSLASSSDERPGDHDLAAVLAGPRPDVHYPVSRPDRVLVVLDHDQRVAEVAQPEQRVEQPVVVPLVQPDRRLVQHVQHADQP